MISNKYRKICQKNKMQNQMQDSEVKVINLFNVHNI